jgi:hypothetical protein
MCADLNLVATHDREYEHLAQFSQAIKNQFRCGRSNRINGCKRENIKACIIKGKIDYFSIDKDAP